VIRLRVLARRAGVAAISGERGSILLRLSAPGLAEERLRALTARSRQIQWTPDGIRIRTDGAGFAESVHMIGEVLDMLAAETTPRRGSAGDRPHTPVGGTR
jgi:hypothetical protein